MSSTIIKYVVPLYKSILLVIMEHLSLKKRDAVLLIDHNGDILPGKSTDYKGTIPWPDDSRLDEPHVEVTVEIDAELCQSVQKRCSELGISVEQLIIAFIRFCACPENRDAIYEWLVSYKEK